MAEAANVELPGLDCGLCGYRTCDELQEQLPSRPELLKQYIHLSDNRVDTEPGKLPLAAASRQEACDTSCGGCVNRFSSPNIRGVDLARQPRPRIRFLPGALSRGARPREIILPHNPLITREMDIQVGDILIGRPLGMSCGCPITHCGVAIEVDRRTGVIVWCVTGPFGPRQKGSRTLATTLPRDTRDWSTRPAVK